MKSSKPPLAVVFAPLIIVSIIFAITWLLIGLGCKNSGDECALNWLWLLLWPIFILLFSGAFIISLVLGIMKMKK